MWPFSRKNKFKALSDAENRQREISLLKRANELWSAVPGGGWMSESTAGEIIMYGTELDFNSDGTGSFATWGGPPPVPELYKGTFVWEPAEPYRFRARVTTPIDYPHWVLFKYGFFVRASARIPMLFIAIDWADTNGGHAVEDYGWFAMVLPIELMRWETFGE